MKKMSRLMAFAILGMVASSTIQAQAPAGKSYAKRGREFLWRHKGKLAAAGALGAADYFAAPTAKKLVLVYTYVDGGQGLSEIIENQTQAEYKENFKFILNYFISNMKAFTQSEKERIAKKLWADNMFYMVFYKTQDDLIFWTQADILKHIVPTLR